MNASNAAVTAVAITIAVMLGCGSNDGTSMGYESKVRTEIGSAMKEQVYCWNAGDLAGFMRYYWRSDEMTFHGSKRRLQGWNALNSMYLETYSGERRGVLEFSGLEIEVLSVGSAYVLGDWRVELPDTVKKGKFTLIWRKTGDGWRIVHDHSS
jgi:beta-aspartyl-peptidase (threonine type)